MTATLFCFVGGFGLGFETVDQFGANGLACRGSFSWGGAYGSTYLVDPESRLTMLLMVQLLPLQRKALPFL